MSNANTENAMFSNFEATRFETERFCETKFCYTKYHLLNNIVSNKKKTFITKLNLGWGLTSCSKLVKLKAGV